MRARIRATVLCLDLATGAWELELALELELELELGIRAGGPRMGGAGLGAHLRRRRL